MPLRIEDYAMIGNCRTAALVGLDGSIDWLCWPRFDSRASFAALLGVPDNGRWLVAPQSTPVAVNRRYRPGTLILETEFRTKEGSAIVVDFMPPMADSADLVRLIVGRSGRVAFRTEFIVRFDYGDTVPWVTRSDDGSIHAVAGPQRLVLRTPIKLRSADYRTVGEFSVASGEHVPLVLSHNSSLAVSSSGLDAIDALERTEAFWRQWSDRCPSLGPWTEPVKRSLITLKGLAYQPTGGIVAAATTSLPERLGGVRNWDYRYCWLRDATLTLLAFMNLGYYEEALAWRDWLMRTVAGSPRQIQVMYGVGGERLMGEWKVPWLPGYEGSSPVRIGNGAAQQRQIDVFGEVADAMFQSLKAGYPPPPRAHAIRREALEQLAATWREPDEGIWEMRSGRRHFVHSKVMAWVAFDRAANDLTARTFGEPTHRWRRIANEIRADVCERGFDRDLGSFVQAYDSRQLDASLLMMPHVGFLPPGDPRIRGTLRAIEKKLLVNDTFVLRYETEGAGDGLPAGEGVFLPCSFWLVDNYVQQGRHEEAQRLFTRLLARCNDVGLLAEELDPASGRMLGNFPQAYSHVGLINSALNLTRGAAASRAKAMPVAQVVTGGRP